MKPAQEVDGALTVVRRIVIGAGIGGIVGAGVGWWLDQGGRLAIGSATSVAIPIVLFTVVIGSCVGAAFGAVMAEGRSGLRPSQRFRPAAMLALEGRIALSSFAHSMNAEHAAVTLATPTPSILGAFGREAAAGLAVGHPVYEQLTTTYYDGLAQTANETFVLNNQTVTVTENITLPGAAGTETVVDHYTAMPGAILFQSTVTEPNGQTLTETRTDSFVGTRKILHNGSIQRPDGVTIAFTGNSVEHGTKDVINTSFRESNGISYTTHEVDISQSEWQGSATVTTKWLDGSHQVDKSSFSGVLLSAPPV